MAVQTTSVPHSAHPGSFLKAPVAKPLHLRFCIPASEWDLGISVFRASPVALTTRSQGWRLLVKIAFLLGLRMETRVHTPQVISPPFGILKLSWPSAHKIMRLMANQVLMRIDSFIKLQLCYQVLSIHQAWETQGQAGYGLGKTWGCGDSKEEAKQLHPQEFEGTQGPSTRRISGTRSNKYPSFNESRQTQVQNMCMYAEHEHRGSGRGCAGNWA